MSLANKLFGRITGRGSDDGSDSQSKDAASGKNPDQVVKQFVAKSPKGRYTLNSERDAPQSELCRAQEGERQKECIMIQMHSTRLFRAMQVDPSDAHSYQDNGFFCVLPIDPTQTHIECTPKP